MVISYQCPSCGSLMEKSDGMYVCKHCGNVALDIINERKYANIDQITLSEFTEYINNNSNLFIINTGVNEAEIADVDKIIINEQVARASNALAVGRYADAYKFVSRCASCFAVERIRFLAKNRVKNEQSLMKEMLSDSFNLNTDEFDDILELADEQTKQTYLKLLEFYNNYLRKTAALCNRLDKGYQLIDLELYDEAVAYGVKLVNDYPNNYKSWNYLALAKNLLLRTPFDGKLIGDDTLKMKQCPDYTDKSFKYSIYNYFTYDKLQEAQRQADAERKLDVKRHMHVIVLISFLCLLSIGLTISYFVAYKSYPRVFKGAIAFGIISTGCCIIACRRNFRGTKKGFIFFICLYTLYGAIIGLTAPFTMIASLSANYVNRKYRTGWSTSLWYIAVGVGAVLAAIGLYIFGGAIEAL